MYISIVICTHNRAEFIIGALKSLANQTYDPKLYEVIVVDNNCTDNTEELCKDYFSKASHITFQYVFEYQKGLSFARNKGIEAASGEILTYIDDDAVADKDFVENIVKNFNSYKDYTAVGGKIIPVYPDNKEPDWMSKYIEGLVSKVDYGNETREFKKNKYPVGCNMSFRKDIFDTLGGFNTDITFRSDEKFVFFKLRENKKKVLYAHDVLVHHHIEDHRLTHAGVKKTSLIIGSSERERLRTKSIFYRLMKILEYLFKLMASFILGFLFLLGGKTMKAKYLIKVRWYVLVGFLKP